MNACLLQANEPTANLDIHESSPKSFRATYTYILHLILGRIRLQRQEDDVNNAHSDLATRISLKSPRQVNVAITLKCLEHSLSLPELYIGYVSGVYGQ